MRATRFTSLCLLTVCYVKTAYAGCLQTGHSDGDGRCDEDGDCCDTDAFCNTDNKCSFEKGKSCDFSQQCDSTMLCYKGECSEDIDIFSEKTSCESCEGNTDDSIDWECVLGKGALDEVASFGGRIEPCDEATSSRPCTTFIVDKEDERAEVKVNSAAEHYHMEKDEEWLIKYSFRPKEDMKVSTRFTHIGQIKPSLKDSMVGGDGLTTITANNKGLHVRFSNQGGSIEDFLNVDDRYIDWDYVTGKWVNVDVQVKFKNSMKVKLSVGDKEQVWEWPSDEDPVAWSNKDMDGVRIKLGVYHAEDEVGDAAVDFRDVAIIGPSDRPSRSSNPAKEDGCETRRRIASPENFSQVYSQLPSARKLGCDSGCRPMANNMIDWECVLGPESVAEIKDGQLKSCEGESGSACTTFHISKADKRAEVKVNSNFGPLYMRKHEEWTIKYSFKVDGDMNVNSNRFTHIGQVKPSIGKGMVYGDALCTLTGNQYGLSVRYSSQGGDIGDYFTASGVDGNGNSHKYIPWAHIAGKWVNVEIHTVFGESMTTRLSGAVQGTYKWPQNKQPVAWSARDSDGVRLKLGVYHAPGEVNDASVDIKDVFIGSHDRDFFVTSNYDC